MITFRSKVQAQERFITKSNDFVRLSDKETEVIIKLAKGCKHITLPHTKLVLNKRIIFTIFDDGNGYPGTIFIKPHTGELIDGENIGVMQGAEFHNTISIIAFPGNWVIYEGNLNDIVPPDIYSSSSSSEIKSSSSSSGSSSSPSSQSSSSS